MRGELNHVDKRKGINILSKSGTTHFNYRGSGKNYIRGQTEIKGNTSIKGGKLCIGSTCLNESQLKKIKSRLRL